ncbi:MAG TPA: bifunctional [glutamate--ammonia ligase]-adenylyl-L-tyrosine phosphorylase/[glutamate--ammonia-ligase] adenylyltransferase [Xanthomonadaceae bacterium]|nr:bifunctional [glutamate--ammonia ligase]-adenylyl-L-tyrosine phosphorylase/[glutamate--ammonia-ligase] adenylyltransferase [Xanthomonadaceae bacterium]
MPAAPSDDLQSHLQRALSRLPGDTSALRPLALASDFAIDTLVRQPALADAWRADPGAPAPVEPVLPPGDRDAWAPALRRYRAACSARLVWRDVQGMDDIGATLAGATRLAERCLALALDALDAEFVARHGRVRDADGTPQRLVVFALGKLGGGELNFSSDVDLVYAFPHGGESDGGRPLGAEDWFARIGQQLAKLLDERTVDGFCHRVDLRLRPFGGSGRVALSFAAMEQYFQREGRDWERYAWQKARPVAGDLAEGQAFLRTLRPFVYRRYLDYGALDGLREMKAAIAAEVARKELADDIKRGPGGIREVEFLVQALQLIRGGREPSLREARLLPALRALVAAGHVAPPAGDALADAYRWLRHLENRLQMLRDEQVHALPEDALDRERIALGLGFEDWDGLRGVLDGHRERVGNEFDALLAPRRRRAPPDALSVYWRALPGAGEGSVLGDAGFDDAAAADAALRTFARAPGVQGLSDAARARLDRVLPALLAAAAASAQPDAALHRALALMHNILRRASYLALLDEQPAALQRLVDVVSRSAFLADRLAAHPLLLDELLDVRVSGPLPDRDMLQRECAVAVELEDPEAALHALNEKRQALSFRIAMATLDGRQPAQRSARQLAWLADAVVAGVLALARREIARAHGVVPGAHFAILGYGSLGGEELNFGSDLDLVFLHDGAADAESDGPRPLDAPRWAARLAQKVVALLGAVTGAGRLYEVDVRLRPDGAKGLLVSTLASYADYQRERAWTWEHQALVRARGVAGDAGLLAAFDEVRRETLARPRNPSHLRGDVATMRAKMRRELDRSRPGRFDLKQGPGGLVDLEFLLQYRVLRDADRHPALLVPRDTPGLLRAVCGIDAGPAGGADTNADCDALHAAHATLLAAGLGCSLDRRPRVVAVDAELEAACEVVRRAFAAEQLDSVAAGADGGPG